VSRIDIQSAFDSLRKDIEALRPRHRSSAEVQAITHQVIAEILELDIERLAQHPAAKEKLVDAVAKTQRSLGFFFELEPGAPSPELLTYMDQVRNWVLSLPGKPTTPPPIFKAPAIAR